MINSFSYCVHDDEKRVPPYIIDSSKYISYSVYSSDPGKWGRSATMDSLQIYRVTRYSLLSVIGHSLIETGNVSGFIEVRKSRSLLNRMPLFDPGASVHYLEGDNKTKAVSIAS